MMQQVADAYGVMLDKVGTRAGASGLY